MVRKTKEESGKTRNELIEAARVVFHQCGVSRSTFDKIAKEAGVTRGAVYWHFKDKAELFFAMREHVLEQAVKDADSVLLSESFQNPLDAIEASLLGFFHAIHDRKEIREVLEIMISRCEYVEEFSCVQDEISRSANDFLEKIISIYKIAQERNMLREEFDPIALAYDTWAFTSGVLQMVLKCRLKEFSPDLIKQLVQNHIALRRP